MSIRLQPRRSGPRAVADPGHDALEQAVAASHRRAVLATDEADEAAATLPGVEVVVVRAASRADWPMRLVRRLARLDDPPRIVVVGDGLAGPGEALAAGADAWIDARAELDTVLVAMHGRPRPPASPSPRRWWQRR